VPRKNKTANRNAERTPSAVIAEEATSVEKASRRTASKPNKSPAKKRAVKRSTKTAGAGQTSIALPTDEDIRLRAYFIAERRHRLALAGDADSDWLEAKRQLLSEVGPR
jgi:DUF2934 family protein